MDALTTFNVVSLFLLAVVGAMLVLQLLIWVIVLLTTKTRKIRPLLHQSLLAQANNDWAVQKVTWKWKFNNLDLSSNTLKMSTREIEETTWWNSYQNLLTFACAKSKIAHKKTHIIMLLATILFYLSVISTIVCVLIYYLNAGKDLFTDQEKTALSIWSFVNLLWIVGCWLVWTMSYEKLRKEIILLLNDVTHTSFVKFAKRISAYKTFFPGSELLI